MALACVPGVNRAILPTVPPIGTDITSPTAPCVISR